MRIVTLYSGSGGNATYVQSNEGAILIDAGRSAKQLCLSLCEIGSSIDKIDAIFITHEHSDHVSALETLTKKHDIPVHILSESAKRFCSDRFESIRRNLVLHEPIFCETVKDMKISSFVTPHDSRASVGYRIDVGEKAYGVATDMGYVTKTTADALFGCEAVVLESNHDVEMLECGPYPYDLKYRILSKRGHLSNTDSSLFAAHLARNGTRAFILAHLSEENNTPDTALDAFLSTVADKDVRVAVADPTHPTEIEL